MWNDVQRTSNSRRAINSKLEKQLRCSKKQTNAGAEQSRGEEHCELAFQRAIESMCPNINIYTTTECFCRRAGRQLTYVYICMLSSLSLSLSVAQCTEHSTSTVIDETGHALNRKFEAITREKTAHRKEKYMLRVEP